MVIEEYMAARDLILSRVCHIPFFLTLKAKDSAKELLDLFSFVGDMEPLFSPLGFVITLLIIPSAQALEPRLITIKSITLL